MSKTLLVIAVLLTDVSFLLARPRVACGYSFLQSAHGPVTFNADAVCYMAPGVTLAEKWSTEAHTQVPYYTPGIISGLWVMVGSNVLTSTTTVRVRINGVDGNQVVSIPPGQFGEFRDATHSDAVNPGDLVDYKVVAGTGTSISIYGVATIFSATTNSMLRFVSAGSPYASSTNGFATYYEPVSGILGAGGNFANQTESFNYYHMKNPGTFSKLGIYVNANSRTGSTTIRFRKNGVNGNQVITIGAGLTGLFQDTTSTDAVAAGDAVDYAVSMDGTNGADPFSASWVGTEFATTNGAMEYPAQTQGHSIQPGTTYYSPIQGALGFDSAEVNDYQVLSQVSGTMSKMHAYVQSNTLNVPATIQFRKNQTNGTQVLTIPAGTTGYFEDATHTDSVLSTDKLDYRFTTPAGTGNAPFNYVGGVLTAAGGSPPSCTP